MTPLDVLASRVRERDRQELAEYGMRPADVAASITSQAPVLFHLWTGQSGPAAFVAFHALTPVALSVSMLATEDWPHVARDVYRWGVIKAKRHLLSLGFVRAECRTMDGHEDAIRLLEHLGFKLECRVPGFGATGRDFLQYAWRLTDHVHLSVSP